MAQRHMKQYRIANIIFLVPGLFCFIALQAQRTFVGSTPAHLEVREFLQISLSDSIDFIRWTLVMDSGSYELSCRYGLARGGTPGFVNEKQSASKGILSKNEHYRYLENKGKRLSILEVNSNLLHLLDHDNQMLVGNGGYSYALNSTAPVRTEQFNIQSQPLVTNAPLVFEGRTPCQELSRLLGLNKSEACNKMKWYIIFYADPETGKPSHYLKGGNGYKKESMEKGKWEIISKKNGRIIYQLKPDNEAYSLHLLKGDDNILFFVDPGGQLLVGNEDFSYTLNRRKEEYPRARSSLYKAFAIE